MHCTSMEIALFRTLMMAIPDVDDFNAQKVDELWFAAKKFFQWEHEVIRLKEPSPDDIKDHREGLQALTRIVKLLLKLEDNKRLRLLLTRLNESQETFYNPLDDVRSAAILAKLSVK